MLILPGRMKSAWVDRSVNCSVNSPVSGWKATVLLILSLPIVHVFDRVIGAACVGSCPRRGEERGPRREARSYQHSVLNQASSADHSLSSSSLVPRAFFPRRWEANGRARWFEPIPARQPRTFRSIHRRPERPSSLTILPTSWEWSRWAISSASSVSTITRFSTPTRATNFFGL